MNSTRMLFRASFMLLIAQGFYGQNAADSDDVRISLRSCRVVEMTLNARTRMRATGDVPEDDDFTAAAKACDQLNRAISTSDASQIQAAAKSLHAKLSQLGLPPSSPQEQLTALEKKTSGQRGRDLFYNLADLAKRALDAGENDKAEAYSKQLLQMAPRYSKDWNYGNAIFYGNFVLGRIAVKRGSLKQAGQYLLAAGATPGSAQLDSFGPNMILAKELLQKGQSGVVLQYLALCRNFWEDGHRQLDEWSAEVRNGGIPDFNRSLNY